MPAPSDPSLRIPQFSVELIEMLDRNYPPKPPNPADTEREIWMKAGERRLVQRLLNLKNTPTEGLPNVLVDARYAKTAAASSGPGAT